MALTAIGFDLDGTLFDDRQYARVGLEAAANTINTRYGIDLREELLRTYFQEGKTENTFDIVLNRYGLPTALVPELVDAYHDTSGDLTPFPGVVETLDVLHSSHDLGLLTGGRNGRDKLNRLDLTEYFDVVVIAPEQSMSKQTVDPFEELVQQLNVNPHNCLYVGDRPELDFVHPNRLGMMTVQVRTGVHTDRLGRGAAEPDHIINSVRELPLLLDRLGPQ